MNDKFLCKNVTKNSKLKCQSNYIKCLKSRTKQDRHVLTFSRKSYYFFKFNLVRHT